MKINRFGRAYRYYRHAGCFSMVGSMMQAGAAAGASSEMNKAAEHEIQRQSKKFQQPAYNVVRGSIAGAGAPNAQRQMAQGTQKAKEGYARAQQTPLSVNQPGGVTMGTGTPASNAWADLAGALKAPLQGYNEFELQQQIKNLRAAQQLGVIAQLSEQSAKTGPSQIQDAANKWQWLNTLGQSFGAGGNSGLMAAGVM